MTNIVMYTMIITTCLEYFVSQDANNEIKKNHGYCDKIQFGCGK